MPQFLLTSDGPTILNMSMSASNEGIRVTQDDDGTVVFHVRPGARFKVVEDQPTPAKRLRAEGLLAGKVSYVPTWEDFEELSAGNIAANDAANDVS